MTTILKLENLNYGYEDGGYKRQILKDLSYEFEQGQFYTILGPSGSGKTTLLSIIAGLDKQESGKIYYEGDDLDKIGLYKYRRNKIGIVFQQYNLISYLTGLENIELAMTETDNAIPKNQKEVAYGDEAVRRRAAAGGDCTGDRVQRGFNLCGRTDRQPGHGDGTGDHQDLPDVDRGIREDGYRRHPLQRRIGAERSPGSSQRGTAEGYSIIKNKAEVQSLAFSLINLKGIQSEVL